MIYLGPSESVLSLLFLPSLFADYLFLAELHLREHLSILLLRLLQLLFQRHRHTRDRSFYICRSYWRDGLPETGKRCAHITAGVDIGKLSELNLSADIVDQTLLQVDHRHHLSIAALRLQNQNQNKK